MEGENLKCFHGRLDFCARLLCVFALHVVAVEALEINLRDHGPRIILEFEHDGGASANAVSTWEHGLSSDALQR